MRRDKIYSAPHLLLPLSLLLACSSCRGEVISQELSKGCDFGNPPDNHLNNGQTEMLGFKLIFSSKRKLAFKKQKFERIWLFWTHFCMPMKLFFTWKMIETNIQSNVPVICVVMELLEDGRKGSKSPRLPDETTVFRSPLYSSCESATLGTSWVSPHISAHSHPTFHRYVVHQEGLEPSFLFQRWAGLPVSKWIVVCRVLLSERRDQLWCNSKDPGDREDLGVTPWP